MSKDTEDNGSLAGLFERLGISRSNLRRSKTEEKLDPSIHGTPNPQSTVSINKDDPIKEWKYFQTSNYDETSEKHGPYHPEQFIPKKFNKKHFPDYRPGKVKVYTREEIEQYERERGRVEME